MATIKLIPSTYYLSSSTYLRVSNADDMYDNTDSTTYGTVTNSQSGTTTYYIYLRGFNFDDIPSAAVVSGFTVKLKARESGINTSSSYSPKLCHGTSQITSTCSAISTTASCRRASRNTTGYMYIYGAEIEVTYTVPDPRTITSTLSGDGTISPSGAITSYDGEEYELTITPTNKSDQVTATQDGVDITSQLVAHGAGSTISAVPEDVTTNNISSGSSYAQYAVGNSAEDPYSSSSNMYSPSGSTGYAAYSFNFSSIPSNATIEEITVRCYGHRESSTIDSSHVSNVALYYGSTMKGEDVDFPSTSNSLVTIENTGTWTRAELDNLTLRHTVGYYGGLVLGITIEVTYSTGTGIDHYTYTYTVNGDSTIAVVIGSASTGDKIYVKQGNTWKQASNIHVKVNGTWQKVAKVWKKVSGSWVLQPDKSSLFSQNVTYINGGNI